MSIVFLRTATDHGPRTIIFCASETDARLLSKSMAMDIYGDVPPMVILPDRPAYNSVAQILKLRQAMKPDMKNIRLFSQRGAQHDRGRSIP